MTLSVENVYQGSITPCAVRSEDKNGNVKYSPIMELGRCGRKCGSCGFNPEEQKRRLREGRFDPITRRRNQETGELIWLPEGVRRLVFPRNGAGEEE